MTRMAQVQVIREELAKAAKMSADERAKEYGQMGLLLLSQRAIDLLIEEDAAKQG